MSKKPMPQEGPLPSKTLKFFWVQYVNPPTFCLALGVIIASLFLYYRPWQIHTLHTEEINTLKNLTIALNDRIKHLESAEKAISPSPQLEQINTFENRITTLQQQIEALQNQPKMEGPSEQLEKSQTFEKDLGHLAETQKIIKTTLIFWRLKNKILSDAPYAVELLAYKAIGKLDGSLSLLDKYADQGLQALKIAPEEYPLTSSENQVMSWWDRLTATVRSLIKIQKIGTPVTQSASSLQDRQAIEDLLARIDQALAQQLDVPLPGEPLK